MDVKSKWSVSILCICYVVSSWQIQWDGSNFIVLSAMKTKDDNVCCLGGNLYGTKQYENFLTLNNNKIYTVIDFTIFEPCFYFYGVKYIIVISDKSSIKRNHVFKHKYSIPIECFCLTNNSRCTIMLLTKTLWKWWYRVDIMFSSSWYITL